MGYVFISPWLIGFIVFTLGAMIYSFVLSFYETNLLTTMRPVGLRNYTKMAGDPLFYVVLANTAYYTFVGVPLRIAGGLAIAILLNRSVPLLGVFRTLYYLPVVVSGVAAAILWRWMFDPAMGVINYVLSLLGIESIPWLYSESWAMPALIIMSLWYIGENMVIYLAGLKGVPVDLYEAAEIDGATAVTRFFRITLPLITPTILFTLVTGLIGSFQVFTFAYVMTEGGPNNATVTYVLYLYRKAFEQFEMGYASSLAWVLLAIVLLATLAIFKSSPLWVYYEAEMKK